MHALVTRLTAGPSPQQLNHIDRIPKKTERRIGGESKRDRCHSFATNPTAEQRRARSTMPRESTGAEQEAPLRFASQNRRRGSWGESGSHFLCCQGKQKTAGAKMDGGGALPTPRRPSPPPRGRRVEGRRRRPRLHEVDVKGITWSPGIPQAREELQKGLGGPCASSAATRIQRDHQGAPPSSQRLRHGQRPWFIPPLTRPRGSRLLAESRRVARWITLTEIPETMPRICST